MKLILIDDDCLVVSALKMILENEPDFEVAATAEDGSAAPALYREHRPDVLLMDIRMKQKNGLDAAEEILKEFEMDDKQDKLGNELSKGMMQKVSICCALAVKPQVILLDEPMVGLDPAAIRKLKEVVLKLRDQGVTVLISTHMLEMVEELWDIMFVMEKGHIIGSYTREDAKGRDLDELFFAMTGGEKE